MLQYSIDKKLRWTCFEELCSSEVDITDEATGKFGDIFHRSMFSVMLLRCLKRGGYFGPDRTDVTPAGDSLSEDELFIGHLLNHFLEVLQFNSHEVAQFEMIAKNREEGAESNFIGAGRLARHM